MPAWDERKFNESKTKGDIQNLYYLYGEEVFLLDEAVTDLVRLSLGDGLADFNLNTFYGQDASAEQIKDAVETLPMMTSRRVVVVKEAQDIKEKALEPLLSVIEEPVESTTLIFVASKVDKRKKFYKTFLKKGAVVEFRKPYDNQIPAWIKYIAGKHELQMGDREAGLVHEFVGSNLLSVDSEMRKLSQYLGDRRKVTIEDIESIVSHVRVDSVFDLANAIGDKDRAGALTCLANILEHGQNDVGALALITRHVRILTMVQEGFKQGLRGGQLSSKVGVPPFFLNKYLEQSRKWSSEKLASTYRALLETDRALKSSPISSHIWLENFVLKTC